jgi:hypothetical protein
VYVTKSRISVDDIEIEDADYDLRLSLMSERACMEPGKVPRAKAQSLKLKKRWSFIHKKSFRFDFSVIWSAPNTEMILNRWKNKPPLYHIEVEILPNALLRDGKVPTSRWLAESMLLKVNDLLRPPPASWTAPVFPYSQTNATSSRKRSSTRRERET